MLKRNLKISVLLLLLMFRANAQVDVIAATIKDDAERANYIAAAETEPLTFYCPNGANEKYINTVGNCLEKSKVPVVLCTYANGVGKTNSTIHILMNFIFGQQNGWFDFPIYKNFPYPKTAWYCSRADTLRNTIEPMIDEIVKPKLHVDKDYRTDKQGKTIVSKMTFSNGWTIYFKTYEQEPGAFEGATVGVIILDEPAPQFVWNAIKSRRRMGCIILYPNTPLYCPPYVIDELQAAADNNRPGYYHLTADVYEACMERGVRGHLDPEIIDDMVDGYDEEEKEARVYGRYMFFSGLIYSLDRKIHFVNPEDYPIPEHAEILQMVDPHDSRPSAGIWGAVRPGGRKIIFDEYPADKSRPFWDMRRKLSVPDEVKEFIDIEDKYWRNHTFTGIRRIMDRHFGWQTRGQKTMAQLFLDGGAIHKKNFNYEKSYNGPSDESEIMFGHKKVREALKPMADGKPGLVIYNTCYHTWNGMSHYIKKALTGKIIDEKAAADGKIIEKYKDYPDVVRHFVCADAVAGAPKKKDTPAWKMVRRAQRAAERASKGYE